MKAKESQRVMRDAERLGCIVTRRRGHWKITCPNGAMITTSASPSDINAAKQLARDLRRYGELDL